MASAEAKPFPAYGRALAGVRDKVHFQIHFGADYIDFGFIHCIDEIFDLQNVQKSGVIETIPHLKQEGIVRHVGISVMKAFGGG